MFDSTFFEKMKAMHTAHVASFISCSVTDRICRYLKFFRYLYWIQFSVPNFPVRILAPNFSRTGIGSYFLYQDFPVPVQVLIFSGITTKIANSQEFFCTCTKILKIHRCRYHIFWHRYLSSGLVPVLFLLPNFSGTCSGAT